MSDIDRFKAILTANNYPQSYIEQFNENLRDRIAWSTTFGYKEPQEPTTTVPPKKINVKIPFFHALVFNDLIRMKSNLRKLIPSLNFHFIVKSFKVDTFFASRRKFQLEPLQKPNLVYEFKCPCNEENYIGETTLRLSARVSSHVNQRPVSSVKEHTDNCPKFQVLYKSS